MLWWKSKVQPPSLLLLRLALLHLRCCSLTLTSSVWALWSWGALQNQMRKHKLLSATAAASAQNCLETLLNQRPSVPSSSCMDLFYSRRVTRVKNTLAWLRDEPPRRVSMVVACLSVPINPTVPVAARSNWQQRLAKITKEYEYVFKIYLRLLHSPRRTDWKLFNLLGSAGRINTVCSMNPKPFHSIWCSLHGDR